MKATVMYEAGDVRIEDVPDAGLVEPTDALIRVGSYAGKVAFVTGAVGLGAGHLGEVLKRRLGLARMIRWLSGSVLIALGLRMAFPGQRCPGFVGLGSRRRCAAASPVDPEARSRVHWSLSCHVRLRALLLARSPDGPAVSARTAARELLARAGELLLDGNGHR